jgi:Holliday junction DNA helicase RuvB
VRLPVPDYYHRHFADRFGFTAQLDFYEVTEIEEIVKRTAKLFEVEIDTPAILGNRRYDNEDAANCESVTAESARLCASTSRWKSVTWSQLMPLLPCTKSMKLASIAFIGDQVLDRLD